MRVMVLLLGLAACGRIGFDETSPAIGNDAAAVVGCSGGSCTCNTLLGCDLSCTSGRCPMTCMIGHCSFHCDSAPCDITCAPGSQCDYTCGAGGCHITASAAQTMGTCTSDCTVSCQAGQCTQTCDQPTTCSCTGLGCV